MSVQTLSPTKIRKLGLEALSKALGPVGMIRFLQQFEGGSGDYTKERKAILKNFSVKEIVKGIEYKRKRNQSA